MKILYLNQAQMFSVEEDDQGALYLCVVVGGVAMSEKKVLMDEGLISLYRADPSRLINHVNAIRHGS
jgi:hypothetical protein